MRPFFRKMTGIERRKSAVFSPVFCKNTPLEGRNIGFLAPFHTVLPTQPKKGAKSLLCKIPYILYHTTPKKSTIILQIRDKIHLIWHLRDRHPPSPVRCLRCAVGNGFIRSAECINAFPTSHMHCPPCRGDSRIARSVTPTSVVRFYGSFVNDPYNENIHSTLWGRFTNRPLYTKTGKKIADLAFARSALFCFIPLHKGLCRNHSPLMLVMYISAVVLVQRTICNLERLVTLHFMVYHLFISTLPQVKSPV